MTTLKHLVILTGLLLLGANYGCAVGMAMSGKKDPEMSVIREGEKQEVVQVVLGDPVETRINENGHRVATYEYEVGNEPSAARAFMHGTFDILTIGLWEVLGTPIEAVQGNKYQIDITYDQGNKVILVGDPVKVKTESAEVKTETTCDYC